MKINQTILPLILTILLAGSLAENSFAQSQNTADAKKNPVIKVNYFVDKENIPISALQSRETLLRVVNLLALTGSESKDYEPNKKNWNKLFKNTRYFHIVFPAPIEIGILKDKRLMVEEINISFAKGNIFPYVMTRNKDEYHSFTDLQLKSFSELSCQAPFQFKEQDEFCNRVKELGIIASSITQ